MMGKNSSLYFLFNNVFFSKNRRTFTEKELAGIKGVLMAQGGHSKKDPSMYCPEEIDEFYKFCIEHKEIIVWGN